MEIIVIFTFEGKFAQNFFVFIFMFVHTSL